MYVTYIMYTYSTFYLRVYQVHIWPRHSPLTEAVFLGPFPSRRCTTWSWDWWPTWPMAAWQKIGWRKLGSCTAQLLIQSGLGAIKMFHTIDTQLDHMASIFIFGGPVLRRVAGDDLPPVFTKDMSNLAPDAEIVLRGRLTTTISTGPHGVTITKG
jgi:hypothetical protein